MYAIQSHMKLFSGPLVEKGLFFLLVMLLQAFNKLCRSLAIQLDPWGFLMKGIWKKAFESLGVKLGELDVWYCELDALYEKIRRKDLEF